MTTLPRVLKISLGIIVVFIAGFLLGQGRQTPLSPPAEAQRDQDIKINLPNLSPLASKLKPGVVFVVTETDAEDGLPRGHPETPDDPQEGLGSGFIISREGLVLTNYHVVEGANKVRVVLSSGQKHSAKIVGRDQKLDVALLRIKPRRPLTELKLGNSSKAKIGQWVVAMGNPFGLENNVTVGVISGKGRELPEVPFVEFIQTDAAIYPGNSGGPLVDMEGNVIGINTAVVSGTQLGFSIPINLIKAVMPELKAGRKIKRGYIGVAMEPVSDLPDEAAAQKGVFVAEVMNGGPADKAGVKKDDIITRFKGREVESPSDLARLVANSSPGQSVTIELKRDNTKKKLTLVVGEAPSN